VQEWRGARWVNERDETQNVGVQMEEGWKILEGKEVKSYITSGSCEGKGRIERGGRTKGYPSGGAREERNVRKADKDKERKRDGKVTEERMYEMEGQRAIFERSDEKGDERYEGERERERERGLY